ncbi:MAG: hypothetical protein AB1468_05860 [Candidatus Micrarchaeota archaeon]
MKIKHETEISRIENKIRESLREQLFRIKKWLGGTEEAEDFLHEMDRYVLGNFLTTVSVMYSPYQRDKGSDEWYQDLWDLYGALGRYLFTAAKIRHKLKHLKEKEIGVFQEEMWNLLRMSKYENLIVRDGVRDFNKKLSEIEEFFERTETKSVLEKAEKRK